jgi:hypothetical protein
MTDQEINKAIFDFIFESEESQIFRQSFYKDYEFRKPVQRELNYIKDPSKIDYCNDLNAMYEAERFLTKEQIEVFCEHLLPKHHGVWWGIHTTAQQRAKAFLKTINKWKE